MKINKTAALITAAALTISPLTANAAAQKPVFPQFNKNEVNGTVTVNIPDGAVADIDITFDSPEGKGFSYYTVKDAAKGEYSFDIEGRDNTKDDYRYYQLTINLKETHLGTVSSSFSEYIDFINDGSKKDSFLIPDKNDNPESYKKYTYDLTVKEAEKANSWEVKVVDKVKKSLTFNQMPPALGDVNNDGKIDAVDASATLTAYAKESAKLDSGLSEIQKKTADVNKDGNVDGNDASFILSYYAYISAEKDITLDEFSANRNKKA